MTEQSTEQSAISKDPKADVGSKFISNYPPYSVWSSDHVSALQNAMAQTPEEDTPLGLYLHIPFCRKRCKFCYFKVYTDRNSKEIQAYLDAACREIDYLSQQPAVKGRKLNFLYIGGGTPSYISARHLRSLIEHLRSRFDLSELEEFTFECEPGTLTEAKLKAIQDVGVTRLSLGVENFDDAILEENGRAHLSTEIYRVQPWLKTLHFGQLNIDLISGMVGETWENWKENIRKTIEYDPDSVTIYQLELPFNTVYSSSVLDGTSKVPFADWDTKRSWHDYAINTLGEAGYEVSSAYTMVKKGGEVKFRYRDALWTGADLLAVGVSSFGHINGVHYQNEHSLTPYMARIDAGESPVRRAFATTPDQRLIRQMILQLKLGRIQTSWFSDKFGADIINRWQPVWQSYEKDGMLAVGESDITLTRKGLLQVDGLLPAFYEDEYHGVRYT